MHDYIISSVTGPGSGVAFHFHGPTFAETIYGRKVKVWTINRIW